MRKIELLIQLHNAGVKLRHRVGIAILLAELGLISQQELAEELHKCRAKLHFLNLVLQAV